MSLPQIVSRDEWLAARQDLLVKEKALTRSRDALNAARRRLPMVEITKPYVFTGPDGEASLLDLFDGHLQLILGHMMFDPRWEDGCSSCSAGADEVSRGLIEHLHTRDTELVYVSRAPIDKLERWRSKKGWFFPWYSSYGSDFNYDFDVTLDASVKSPVYNYRDRAGYEQAGSAHPFDFEQPAEMPGTSVFLRHGERVFHTYSSYARGTEMTGGSYYFLDLTPLGRQEEWEEPAGRSDSARSAQPGFAS
jgi:predicted dithiol-disulfide oxidoreductase (DUF899 family)